MYSSSWFNHDSEVARAELKRANKQFRKYRSHELHEALVTKRNNIVKSSDGPELSIIERKRKGSTIWRLQIPKHSGKRYAE